MSYANAYSRDLLDALDAADIVVTDQGTMWTFRPKTDAGKAFLTDQVQSEPWQWLGGSLGVDHRPARDLLDAIHANTDLNIVCL